MTDIIRNSCTSECVACASAVWITRGN